MVERGAASLYRLVHIKHALPTYMVHTHSNEDKIIKKVRCSNDCMKQCEWAIKTIFLSLTLHKDIWILYHFMLEYNFF